MNAETIQTSERVNAPQQQPQQPATAQDPFLGTLFEGKYRIERKIGEGGMGVVYQATHIFMERPVAIKFLHGDRVADNATLERFKREAMAAGRIQHPNATATTDFGVSDNNIFYLVMEYLEGRTLRDRMRAEGALPLNETVRIISQVCGAVEAAHKRNIVHRDLKPDNIFLQMQDGVETVKVLDFGIAKITHTGAATAGLTEAGMIVGTPYYMSPEQCQSDNLDARADIYSIGVIIFEMLTGKLPFTGDSPLSIALKHVSETVPSPRNYRPDLPEEVEAVILRAMAKKRQDRQQSCILIAEELAEAAGFPRHTGEFYSRPGTGQLDYGSTRDLVGGATTGETNRHATQPIESNEGSPDMETQMSAKGRHTVQDKLPGSDANAATVNERAKATGKLGPTKKGQQQQQPPAKTGGKKDPVGGGTMELASARAGGELEEVYAQQPEIVSTGRSKMPIFIGGGVLVLILVVVGVIFLKPSTPTPAPGPEVGGGTDTKKDPQPLAAAAAMVEIPGGSFKMGRDEGKDQFGQEIPIQETPAHTVTVKPFFISKYEVTNREYTKFLNATGHPAPPDWKGSNEGAADQPVTNVSWEDAVAYCKWLAQKEGKPYRLPTEEEWEFAARGTESRLFPWGMLWEPDIANTKDRAGTVLPITSSALAKDSSPFGIIAMVGNVSEWVSSDAKLYPGNPAELDPGLKVARGSSYDGAKYTSTATFRLLNPPTFKAPTIGFRIAMDK